MPRIKTTRKARFAAALALTGMTQKEWAKGKISEVHLSRFLNGHSVSAPLAAKIDAFISEVEQKVMAGAA